MSKIYFYLKNWVFNVEQETIFLFSFYNQVIEVIIIDI